MTIRRYTPADCAAILQLFYDTVHTVNARDYSAEQLAVWAPETADAVRWNASLSAHTSVVAEEEGRLLGFGDLDGDYLDRLYVHKDAQRRGIATAIADALEAAAQEQQQTTVTVHASLTAKPFFEKRGYRVLRAQQAERSGIFLINFVMCKQLLR